ncbi:hypothetical protein ACPCJU_16880 [Streptomyces thermodiastaticus]
MTPMPITTGPAVDLPGPVAAVVVAALIVIAAGAPLGVFTPRPEHHARPNGRARHRADRHLARLARQDARR